MADGLSEFCHISVWVLGPYTLSNRQDTKSILSFGVESRSELFSAIALCQFHSNVMILGLIKYILIFNEYLF